MTVQWRRLWAGVLSCVVAGMVASACFTFPEPYGIGGTGTGGAPTTCNTDADCDDDEACTTDACGLDKVCTHDPLANGPAPDGAQTAGDCKTVVCVGGKAKSQPEDDDLFDDGEDCTIDSCNGGEVFHTSKPDDTMCVSMGSAGHCKIGVCEVSCASSFDCVQQNPCVAPECDTAQGLCLFPAVTDGTPTPGVTQTPGDCKINLCVGGVPTDVPEDSDTPVSATDCDTEVCDNGVASNPGLPKHNLCTTYNGSQPGFCDGNGTCQECVEDQDCPGVTDDCKRPACDQTTFKCVEAYTPAGTPTTNPPQVIGDCQTLVCDGNGGTTNTYNNVDPEDDGVECKLDVCASPGVTNHPNAPDVTTKCGTGGLLSCLGGVCKGCTIDAQCAVATCAGTVLTKHETCNVGQSTCVGQPTQNCAPYLCSANGNGSCTTSCNNDSGCDQSGFGSFCSGNQCLTKLINGVSCGGNNQCQSSHCVDGVCCNTTCTGSCQACSTAKKGGGVNGQCGAIANGTDPDSECPNDGTSSCDRDGSCNGAGACRLYAAGTVCTGASCGGTTLTKQKTCDGNGTCVTPNPATQDCAPYVCQSAMCTGSCTNDTQCASGNYCSGGMCVAKQANGSVCSGTNECSSGNCVDGFCCNSACNTACQACAASLKQSSAGNGQCGSATTNAADPRSLCGMSPPCGNTGLCANGGVCQKTASGTQCQGPSCIGSTITSPKTCDGSGACNLGGTPSACPGNLNCSGASACLSACGTQDSNCIAGYYCDGVGAGACQPKIATGVAGCGGDNECASNHCGLTNGVCCSADCPDQGSTTCGTNGACAMGTGACQFYDTATTCSASTCTGSTLTTFDHCNGSGTCSGNMMVSGCPNGYNCNGGGTACRTSCSSGSDCQAGYTCMGSVCKLATGSACTMDASCASGVCGIAGVGFCCTAACSTSDPICKATACAMTTGACVYPGSSTSCGATSCNTTTDQITDNACNGSGTCSPFAPAACPGNLQCANGTSCEIACGADNATGDAKCVSTHYCNGASCVPDKATGQACTRSSQCANGNCLGSNLCN